MQQTDLAAAIFLGTTVTEEGAILGIGEIMVLVADLGANAAYSHTIHHLAGVAVVPVLVHELLLGDGEGAQLVVQRLLVLQEEWSGHCKFLA